MTTTTYTTRAPLIVRRAGRTFLSCAAMLSVLGGTASWLSSERLGRSSAELPVAARGVVARALGRDDARLAIRRGGKALTASNLRAGVDAVFTRHGGVVRADRLSWALGLRALGRGNRLAAVGAVSPVAAGNCVRYARPGVAEWYVNSPLGLEQGFTLTAPPAGGRQRQVTLALGQLPAGARATVSHDRHSVTLQRSGVGVLRYSGLFASDARGRAQPARIVLVGGALSLRIDDREAQYPVTVDPFVQAGKLTASDGAAGDGLGSAIAVSADTIAVGAPNAGSGRGSVYVFVKPAGGWAAATQTAKLTASDGAGNDLLGTSVAISGDTIVAGAPRATVSGHQAQGAGYVFVKPAGGWATGTESSKLTATDGTTSDQFGSSVAIDGATIVVGAQWASPNAFFGAGAAYVFVGGVQAAKLLAVNGQAEDNFGSAVGVSGDTVAVGAAGARNLAGAVYVFVKPAGAWANATPTATLTASDGHQGDHLGVSVGVSGDTVAAGATGATVGAQRPGAVYVFVKPAGGWSDGNQTGKLVASDGAASDQLGGSVVFAADTIVAGAPGAGGNQPGAMYLFGEPPVGWADGTESAKLTASDGAAGDRFGVSAGISTDGGTLAAGASAAGPGAAYVFTAGAGGGARPTSTSVSCAPGSVAVSQATMCTATVNDTGPDPRATPTGIVTFAGNSHGTFSGPSCALGAGGSCHVDYTPSAADSGIHRITASYRGDGAHTASNGAANLTVNAGDGGSKRPTSTSVVFCIPPTVTVGSSASCRATVTDAGNGPALTPTGTLRFSSNSHGTFAGASCSLAEVNATSAGCNVVYVPSAVDSGTHGLTATYGGDAVHDPSSGRGTLTVRPPALPQNTAPPSIISDQSCQSYFGRLVCRPIPYQYLCQPGQWSGTTPGAPFQFEWQQLYYRRQGVGLTSFWRTEPNGSSQTFYAAPPKLDLVPGAIASGTFRCLVTASGPGGSTTANSPLTRLQVAPSLPSGVPRPTSADVHVTGIEVTQGVQEAPCGGCVFSDPSHVQCETCAAGTLPSRDQANGDTPGNADYTGVTMAAGKQTVVRVYANFSRSNCSRPPCTLAANAQLEVLDSAGHRILLLNPAVNELITPGALRPPSAACPLCVDLATRANPKSSFYFLIPAQDTLHRSVTFRATVTPQVGPILPGQCGGCRGNVFTLHGVPFKQPATLTIWPIPLDDEGIPGSPRTALSLSQIFGSVQAVYPNPVRVLPWDGTLDVEGLGNEDAVEEVEDRASDNDLSSGVYPVGVFFRGESGGLNGTTPRGPGRLFTDDGPPASIVGDFRPLTMVAHEIGHGMALGHADDAHPHPDGSANCGGDSNGQQGEGWPPDFEGRIQGVGLDLRSFSLFQAGSLPTTFVEGFDHSGNSTSNPLKGAKYFDFMSYCPAPAGSGLGSLAGPAGGFPPLQQYTESLYWLSPHNWQRLLDYHAPPQMLPAAADRSGREASGTPLRVIATVKPGGATTIHDVTPGKRLHLGPTPGSPFRIQLRDATGKVLTTVVPATVTIHTDGVARQGLMLAATLPFSPGTAAVVVTGGGQDLARRTRSAHAPTGRFVSPRRGARVGRARTTVVRWTEHDADGDRLTSDVDYSAHGGHSWRVVAGPEHGTSARISSRLLSASQNGRLRVRISDGFNVTTLTSGRFRAAGAPPMVQIVGAPRRGRVLQMALLPLQGSAYDDAGRPLTGRHLTWYLDRRRIGRGEFALAAHLRAGNTTIRLVATDSHGRKAQAVLPLHVKAVAARYLLFDAPLLVSRRARTVKIRIAASGPATFTIVGRRYAVGLRLRSITVHIRRGKQPLRLPCSLRSPGGVVKGTYVALRG